MILDNLLAREEETRVKVISGYGVDRDATLKAVFGKGTDTVAGVAVDEEAAMGVSAFYCGVRLLSWGPAQLPLGVYQREANGDKTPRPDLPSYRVVHDVANPTMTAMKVREIGQVMKLLWGRGLAWIERDDWGRVKGLWPLHTRDVRIERSSKGEPTYDITRCKDEAEFPEPPTAKGVLFHRDVLDVPNFSGKSTLENAREELGETIAAQQLGAGFYAGGSLYAFALTTEKKLNEEAKKNLRNQLQKVHGLQRRTPVLDEGMQIDKYGMPFKDVQFIESRQWHITQVARWLDIPPHKLKDLTRATFSNIEEQRLEWYESLLPHLVQWEAELTRKLFRQSNLFVEHVVDGILKADVEKRYEAHQKGVQSGFTTLNEVRRRENQNTLGEAGDVVLVPQNMHVVPITPEARTFYTELGLIRDPDAEPAAQTTKRPTPPSGRYGIGSATPSAKRPAR
jgi:HK97 family phage portal protein